MPSAPSCVGLQVVPYNDPFIVFAELAVDRGPIPVAITEPGDDTIDCEIVYEYGIAEDAQADVGYSVSYLTHIVGEPEPSDEQRQADWKRASTSCSPAWRGRSCRGPARCTTSSRCPAPR